MRNESIRYLIVPGWQGSPEDHWQSHWQNSLPNSARVEQADWLTPPADWTQTKYQRKTTGQGRNPLFFECIRNI